MLNFFRDISSKPTTEQRNELAQRLCLEPRQVRIFFSNTRQRGLPSNMSTAASQDAHPPQRRGSSASSSGDTAPHSSDSRNPVHPITTSAALTAAAPVTSSSTGGYPMLEAGLRMALIDEQDQRITGMWPPPASPLIVRASETAIPCSSGGDADVTTPTAPGMTMTRTLPTPMFSAGVKGGKAPYVPPRSSVEGVPPSKRISPGHQETRGFLVPYIATNAITSASPERQGAALTSPGLVATPSPRAALRTLADAAATADKLAPGMH